MPKDIGLLWLFDSYDSPRSFEKKTGEPAPPFDAGRPPKFWRDLSALKVPRRFVYYDIVALEPNGVTVSKGPDGKPYVGTLRLLREEAASVNLVSGQTNAPGEAEPSVPMPIGMLGKDEYLDWDTGMPFPNRVLVRNRSEDNLRPTTFMVRDQQAIHETAAALQQVLRLLRGQTE